MKWFLILCWVALATCTYPPPPKSWGQQPPAPPCQQKQSIDWVRQNADNLLYLEYMRKQAQGDDEFKLYAGTDEYQQRLNQLRTINTGCGVVDCVLETSCGSNCNSNCEIYGQKIEIFQAELKRQKLMIQRLYSQILVISQSGSSCDCKKFFQIV